jgi:hypothetical protein
VLIFLAYFLFADRIAAAGTSYLRSLRIYFVGYVAATPGGDGGSSATQWSWHFSL